MAASDYDFSVTRTQILERALRQVGALALGETMAADEEAQATLVLNTIVKSWQSRRTFLWSQVTYTQALSAGVGSYALPTSPPIVSLDAGYLRDSDNIDTPIIRSTLSEFRSISDKTATGEPTHYACDSSYLYVWPIPEATPVFTFYADAISKLKDWDAPGSVGDFPVEWVNALVFAVAADLSHEYGLPPGERQALKLEAENYFHIARSGTRGTEDSCVIGGCF